jgi:hypothetical protein
MENENYVKLKGKKLCRAKVVENIIINFIEWYKRETDISQKEEITFSIQPLLWFIMPKNKYRVIQISTEFWNSFLKDPSITISFNHLDPRKDVSKRLFDTFDYYDWKGDGLVIEKVVNEFQFSIITRKENSAGYKGEIKLNPISVDMVEKIIKYQMYWKKGYLHNRPLKSYDEVQKIPLGRKFRKESDLIACMELD